MQVPIPTQKPQNVDIMSGNSMLIFYIFQDRRSFVGSFSQKSSLELSSFFSLKWLFSLKQFESTKNESFQFWNENIFSNW